jgi:hypothetical protein
MAALLSTPGVLLAIGNFAVHRLCLSALIMRNDMQKPESHIPFDG